MTATERDTARVRFPPPFIYLTSVLLGVLLDGFVLPLPFGLPVLERVSAGTVTFLLGGLMITAAFRHFRRTNQDVAPWTPTPEIIAVGIYRRSRNPMYVGLGLLQIGLGLALGNLWVVLLTIASWLAVLFIAILPEEGYLERKFGETYLSYKRSVRRWL